MWNIDLTPEAKRDLKKLDGSVKDMVSKAIFRVAQNPLPASEGGYGKPLGNKGGHNLTGLYKIKIVRIGIRVIYKLIREGNVMRIVVIGARSDDEAYRLAAERKE